MLSLAERRAELKLALKENVIKKLEAQLLERNIELKAIVKSGITEAVENEIDRLIPDLEKIFNDTLFEQYEAGNKILFDALKQILEQFILTHSTLSNGIAVTLQNPDSIPIPTEVEVKGLREALKSIPVPQIKTQEVIFPDSQDVKVLGQPEFLEVEPDDIIIERNNAGQVTQVTAIYPKFVVIYTFQRDRSGQISRITRATQ